MADTSVKLSGTYDSIEAYNIMVEMQNMSADYEEIRTEAAAAASAATAAVTTAQTAANSASTYAGNAQTYAGNANTSAGEAAGYASDASTSASNAATSETNASNSASAAATSAADAAASEAVVAGALPLSGGTMTGNIEFNGANSRKFVIESTDDGKNFNVGWDAGASDGAFLGLRSSDFTNREGEFYLAVRNSQTEYALKGSSTGDLTWKGYNVATDRIENGTPTAIKGTLSGGALRKRGGIVELSFELNSIGASAKAWTSFLKVPEGFRPLSAFDFPMLDNTTGWGVQGKITSSGDVSVWPPSSTIGSVKGHIVYFV